MNTIFGERVRAWLHEKTAPTVPVSSGDNEEEDWRAKMDPRDLADKNIRIAEDLEQDLVGLTLGVKNNPKFKKIADDICKIAGVTNFSKCLSEMGPGGRLEVLGCGIRNVLTHDPVLGPQYSKIILVADQICDFLRWGADCPRDHDAQRIAWRRIEDVIDKMGSVTSGIPCLDPEGQDLSIKPFDENLKTIKSEIISHYGLTCVWDPDIDLLDRDQDPDRRPIFKR